MAFGTTVVAQDTWQRPLLNARGIPGLIDMPTAHAMRDGDMALNYGFFGSDFRTSFHFQITPRLSGSFRYLRVSDFLTTGDLFDRSFDVQFLLSEETLNRPAVSIGIQDLGGTGIYSGEYVVATKTFGKLRGTLGLGWGRYGSYNGFTNPLSIISDELENRPSDPITIQDTGRFRADAWFRGDAALFGGIQYAYSDRLFLTAEYSSDAYVDEVNRTGFERKTPLNVSATYRLRPGLDATFAYLYGSTASVQINYVTNPRFRRHRAADREPGPPPVAVREPGAARDLGWLGQVDAPQILRENVRTVFAQLGLKLESLSLSATVAEVYFRNPSFANEAQAIGYAARSLTQLMPASIETFKIGLVTETGIPVSVVTVSRSDLEELEFAEDGSWQTYARANVEDAQQTAPERSEALGVPDVTSSLRPYISTSLFDPDQPLRTEVGLEFKLRYEPSPGFVLNGRVRQRVGGNVDGIRPSNSVIQRVRTDNSLYTANGDLTIPELTASYFFRPRKNLYGRVSAGYFETMFGGISTEVLWKPVDSRLAIGAEINYAVQRDFDQRFGFQDYDVATGHASLYYDTGRGYHAQLDAGRYLAGDWGATIGLDREFKNGVRIGAFATFTTVSFDDFGEGAFDKGIRFEIPVAAISNQKTKRVLSRTIRPVLRDGGARLEISDRLYRSVKDLHEPGLQDRWGRFWR